MKLFNAYNRKIDFYFFDSEAIGKENVSNLKQL